LLVESCYRPVAGALTAKVSDYAAAAAGVPCLGGARSTSAPDRTQRHDAWARAPGENGASGIAQTERESRRSFDRMMPSGPTGPGSSPLRMRLRTHRPSRYCWILRLEEVTALPLQAVNETRTRIVLPHSRPKTTSHWKLDAPVLCDCIPVRAPPANQVYARRRTVPAPAVAAGRHWQPADA
jgi:hypothetical protein